MIRPRAVVYIKLDPRSVSRADVTNAPLVQHDRGEYTVLSYIRVGATTQAFMQNRTGGVISCLRRTS